MPPHLHTPEFTAITTSRIDDSLFVRGSRTLSTSGGAALTCCGCVVPYDVDVDVIGIGIGVCVCVDVGGWFYEKWS